MNPSAIHTLFLGHIKAGQAPPVAQGRITSESAFSHFRPAADRLHRPL